MRRATLLVTFVLSIGLAVLRAQEPAAVSVTPSSGNAQSQDFALVYSDPNGRADVNVVEMIIGPELDFAASCSIMYVVNASDSVNSKLYLINDAGTNWQPKPLSLVVPQTLQNNQCSIDVGMSHASFSGTTLTMHLAMTCPRIAGIHCGCVGWKREQRTGRARDGFGNKWPHWRSAGANKGTSSALRLPSGNGWLGRSNKPIGWTRWWRVPSPCWIANLSCRGGSGRQARQGRARSI